MEIYDETLPQSAVEEADYYVRKGLYHAVYINTDNLFEEICEIPHWQATLDTIVSALPSHPSHVFDRHGWSGMASHPETEAQLYILFLKAANAVVDLLKDNASILSEAQQKNLKELHGGWICEPNVTFKSPATLIRPDILYAAFPPHLPSYSSREQDKLRGDSSTPWPHAIHPGVVKK